MSARAVAMACLPWMLALAGAAFDAQAQGDTLDAPMHPIDKSEGGPSRCAKCPPADAKELDAQRVADRTAPEYSGVRRPAPPPPEMEPIENPAGGLAGGGQFPVALPLR